MEPTFVKYVHNPKYIFSCMFVEVPGIPVERGNDIYGSLIELNDKKTIHVNGIGGDMFFNVVRECEDGEKERMGVKPGLVSIGAKMEEDGIEGQVINEIFPKAWHCIGVELPTEEAAMIIKAVSEAKEINA